MITKEQSNIQKFKELLQPEIDMKLYLKNGKPKKSKTFDENWNRIYYFLQEKEYVIKYEEQIIFKFENDNNIPILREFIKDFKKLIKKYYYKDEKAEKVKWEDRRDFLIKIKLLNINSEIMKIEQILKKVKINTDFKNINYLLRDINNALEYYLKKDKKYINIDNIISNNLKDYINDEKIKKLRKILQCFRHENEKAREERKKFTKKDKEFFLFLGSAYLIEIDRIIKK